MEFFVWVLILWPVGFIASLAGGMQIGKGEPSNFLLGMVLIMLGFGFVMAPMALTVGV